MGKRGCVVDPVANERDALARAAQIVQRGHLAVGQNAGDHMVDADFAGDSLCRFALVTGDHGNLQSLCVQGADCSGAGRLHGIGYCNDGGDTTVNCSEKCGAALFGQTALLIGQIANLQPLAGHQAVGPDKHLAARHFCPHAVAGDGFKILGVMPRDALDLCRAHDCLGDRVFRLRLDSGDKRQHLGAVKAVRKHEIGQFRAALGNRSGLVQRHHIHAG